MNFVAAATLHLLFGTAIAAPASIATGRVTLDTDANTNTDTLLAPNVDSATPLAARLTWSPAWLDRFKKPEAVSVTAHPSQPLSGSPTKGKVHQRSADAWIFPYRETPKTEDGEVQPRTEPLSDAKWVSLGETLLETLAERSPEIFEHISSLVTRDIDELSTFDGHLAPEGEDQIEAPALERRFFPLFPLFLFNLLRGKVGPTEPPADAPAVSRRYIPALPEQSEEDMARPQKWQEDELQRTDALDFNEAEVLNIEQILLETMQKYFPEDFDQHSSLVARDDEGLTRTTLARRGFFIPGIFIAWVVSVTAASIDAAIMQKNKNEGRDLGNQHGVGPAVNLDLAEIPIPEDIEQYLREHILLEAMEAYSPEGLENPVASLVARK